MAQSLFGSCGKRVRTFSPPHGSKAEATGRVGDTFCPPLPSSTLHFSQRYSYPSLPKATV
eukprot:scaffold3496_cov213-Alexandrium_tamarense.AAC.1